MHSRRLIIISALLILLHAASAYAHRPVIVRDKSSKDRPILVDEPETSWAFYGILEGEPHYYEVVSSEPFNLYVNLLVPDFQPDGEPVLHHDMSFSIYAGDELLYHGDGLQSRWRRFYEEYGRDHYYWGPEFDRHVDAGTYSVLVSNSMNKGRYALAIGKIEKFNFMTIIAAVAKAVYLDTWFFKEK